MGRDGSRGVAGFELVAQAGPGVAARPAPLRRVGVTAVEVAGEGAVAGLGEAVIRFPYAHEGAHEVAPAATGLEGGTGMISAQPDRNAVAAMDALGLPRVRSTQIAHTGCLCGTFRALYSVGGVCHGMVGVWRGRCCVWVAGCGKSVGELQMTPAAHAKWRIPGRDRKHLPEPAYQGALDFK